jgi:hypothetical protein
MRLLVAALALVLIGCSAPSPQPEDAPVATPVPSAPPLPPPVASEPPTMPYEDAGACPFEGCTYREWTARETVQVLTDRKQGAPVAFTLNAGDRITAVTGVVSVTRPGRITFTAPTEIDSAGGRLTMQAGETIYLLTPTGEGHHVASVRGRIVRDVDGGIGTLVEPVQFTWWVQMRDASGRRGWVAVTRQFDGTDRLA